MRWLGVAAVAIGGWLVLSQPAQASQWIFQVPDAVQVNNLPGVNTPPGLPNIRLVNTASTVNFLSSKLAASWQPNYRYRAMFTPNDPLFSRQWNLAVINTPSAWDVDTTAPLYGGDPAVVVAVIDTGVAFENYQSYLQAPDLASTTIWTNPDEIGGDGIDNDGNGLIDDVAGWDFVNNDSHPNDDHGHGTHIAGTIAGSTNNSLSTAGIAFQTTIMPLKGLDEDGNGSTTTITAAITYAVTNGADIINLSLGGDQDDPLLKQVIQNAVARGVVIVAAAGNTGEASITYPARYSEVVAVGASQYDSQRAPYSNTGLELDLIAPGGNVLIDQNADGFPDGILQQTCTDGSCATFDNFFYSGTSQAAAHVSGVAALLAACGAPPGNIAATLNSTATDVGVVGRDDQTGAGLLNAAAALTAAGCVVDQPVAPGPITAQAGSVASRPLSADQIWPYRQPTFSWSGPAGASYQLQWGLVGRTPTAATQILTTYQPSISDEGTYQLRVVSVDALGRISTEQTFRYRYRQPVILAADSNRTSQIHLIRPRPKLLRELSNPLGQVQLQLAGGVLKADGTTVVLVTGYERGRTVQVLNTRGQKLRILTPFGQNFTGQLEAVLLTRRGQDSLIAVASKTNGAAVAWYTATGRLLARQTIYGKYRGGLTLAAVDLDGDGNDELAVAQRAGSEVRIYNNRRQRQAVWQPSGKKFTAGWILTAGDGDGDGLDEIIISPRTSGKKHAVLVLDQSGHRLRKWTITMTGEIALQTLDADGDGRDDLLVGPLSGKPVVQQWSLNGWKQRQYSLPTGQNLSSLGIL